MPSRGATRAGSKAGRSARQRREVGCPLGPTVFIVPDGYVEEVEEILRRPVLVKADPALHHDKFDLA